MYNQASLPAKAMSLPLTLAVHQPIQDDSFLSRAVCDTALPVASPTDDLSVRLRLAGAHAAGNEHLQRDVARSPRRN